MSSVLQVKITLSGKQAKQQDYRLLDYMCDLVSVS